MPNEEKFKHRLIELRDQINKRIDAIDEEIRHEGISADWSEQATERENDEVLESLGINAEQDLTMISLALRRMDEGEYFICSLCGTDIPPERLEILPFSLHCVECAERIEP